jgi:hypothetical protein
VDMRLLLWAQRYLLSEADRLERPSHYSLPVMDAKVTTVTSRSQNVIERNGERAEIYSLVK